MTALTIYSTAEPQYAVQQGRDPAWIRSELQAVGITLAHWDVDTLPAGADGPAVLVHFGPQVQALQASGGYQTVDVISIGPDHPDRATLRQKFIEEHTHAEDEVRFFAQGSGAFYLHIGDRVFQVLCEAGDLINVPAGTRHWFDMGPRPSFTAIRLFTTKDGWVGHFTGDPIARAVPALDQVEPA